MSVLEAPRAAATEAVACTHCGLPAFRDDDDERGPAFCCAGCRTAFQVLHESGLDHYYALAERRERAVDPSGRAFTEFESQ